MNRYVPYVMTALLALSVAPDQIEDDAGHGHAH